MFTIILETANFERLATLTKRGNDAYLIRDETEFKWLGNISDSSLDVFGPERMPELIAELRRVRDELHEPEDVAHVDDIIELAERCAREPGTRLLFAPY